MDSLNQISNLYSDYIKKSYEEKLHSGDILWDAGNHLLKLDKNSLDLNEILNRDYLIRKIAGDLIRQTERMGYTKQYDSASILKDYIYLAYYLAYEVCEKKADRRLLPFLAHILYYENFNTDKAEFLRLKEIYNHSLKLEQKYIENLLNTDRPEYNTSIWGF
ncbi:MAG: hypothetical protein IPJ32_07240 [Sphingobacteriaceae bacterium]|nr:hypothetical protein [Sphingobacteriaceae bacterium]